MSHLSQIIVAHLAEQRESNKRKVYTAAVAVVHLQLPVLDLHRQLLLQPTGQWRQ